MKRMVPTFLVLLTLGAAAPASATPRGYAIIDSKPLFHSPRASARPIATRGLRLLRVVRQQGAWLEVELVTGWSRHCNIRGRAKFGVHLYLRTNDAVEVSRRALTKRLAGGTAVRVVAGTPARGSLLTRVIEAGERTRVFRGGQTNRPATKRSQFRLNANARLVVGRNLHFRLSKGSKVGVVRRSAGKLLVEATRECVQVTGWIPRAAVDLTRPSPPPEDIPEGDPEGWVRQRVSGRVTGPMYGGVLSRQPKSRYVESGATIYWPDGSRAGTVDAMHKVTGIWTTRNRLACATTEVAAGMQRLELCFRPANPR